MLNPSQYISNESNINDSFISANDNKYGNVETVDMSRAEMDNMMIERYGSEAANDNYFARAEVIGSIPEIFNRSIDAELAA